MNAAEDLKEKAAELDRRIAAVEARESALEESQARQVAKGAPIVMTSRRGTNSDEERCLSYFGCKDVGSLLEVNTGHKRFQWVPEHLKQMVRQLKSDFDVSRMIQQVYHGQPLDRGGKGEKEHFAHVKGILDGNYWGKNVLTPKLAAFSGYSAKDFGTGTAMEGAEWVPTGVATQFIEEFELERECLNLYQSRNMPTSPFDLPKQKEPTIARLQGEKEDKPSKNFKTDSIKFKAIKLCEFMCLPEELNEDSAPDILAEIRQEVGQDAIGRALEQATIDGDIAGTHQDADVVDADDARKSWDGLRKLALAASATEDFGAAALDQTKLRAMRAKMGKYGVNPRQLAWKVSPKGYLQMLALPDVVTVEKFGNQATVLRGALAAFDGIPIVISEFLRDDMDANGVHTGVPAADVTTGVLLVNTMRYMLGVRRPIRVRATMNPVPPGDDWLVAGWWRGDWKGHDVDAAAPHVVYGINVA